MTESKILDIRSTAETSGPGNPVTLRLNLIGQMEAWGYDRQNVLPLGRKTRALLAILALSAPRPVVRARLAELLWSRRHEEQARASLRQEIHRLLDALLPGGVDILTITRDYIALRPEQMRLDVDVVLNATAANPAGLDLLTARILDEFDGIDPAFDIWLAGERARVQDRARSVAERVLRNAVDTDAIIVAAQRVIGIDRADEGAWRALMSAHAGRGERGLAMQAYERCRAALKEKLEAAPSAETQRLLAGIRAGNTGTALRFDPPGEPTAPAPAARLENRIGVLPLQMLGTGPDEAYLAFSLADAITAALAAFRRLQMVSSATLHQAGPRDETALRRKHGLEFLIDGSVQRAGSRLRVTIRLLDLLDGNSVIWSHRFDRELSDLLSLQDDIAAEVAGQVAAVVVLARGRRMALQPLADANGEDLVLRALPLMLRMQREEFDRAGALLTQATELEPDYAWGHSWRAFWLSLQFGQAWDLDTEALRREASHHAGRAVALDPQDALCLSIAGHIRAYLDNQPRDAQALHDQALVLNPNQALAVGFCGTTLVYLGEYDAAIRRFGQYMRFAPTGPFGFFFDSTLSLLELMRRDYPAAIRFGRRSTELNPHFLPGQRIYLAALGHSGLHADARGVLRRLLQAEPDFSVQRCANRIPLNRASDRAHFLAGLRLAGVPEDRSAVA